MNAGIRRIIERNAARRVAPDAPPALGPIPVCDEDLEPARVTCPECDGHGWATETYSSFGGYTRTDCEYCNGEGWLDNSWEARHRRENLWSS